MSVSGSCLCDELAFKVSIKNQEIYQCHCSKCRKTSGSNANANIIVSVNYFKWLRPPKTLKQYVTEEKWVSSFCCQCGSKAPIIDSRKAIVYVPAGCLDQDLGLRVTEHIHVSSKAQWDVIGGKAKQTAKQ